MVGEKGAISAGRNGYGRREQADDDDGALTKPPANLESTRLCHPFQSFFSARVTVLLLLIKEIEQYPLLPSGPLLGPVPGFTWL